jgi:hypothetical protein
VFPEEGGDLAALQIPVIVRVVVSEELVDIKSQDGDGFLAGRRPFFIVLVFFRRQAHG